MLKFDQCELFAVVDVARDLSVDFLKLAPSRDFEISSRAVKKLEGATLSRIDITCLIEIMCMRYRIIITWMCEVSTDCLSFTLNLRNN